MIDITLAAADRLRDRAAALFATIGTVADYEALSDLPRSVPAVYLLPLGERAAPSATYGRSTQRHECTFGAVLVVRHAGDATGTRNALALQDRRDAVQSALVNWVPSETCGAVQFAAGELIEASGGMTFWRDEFAVDRMVTHD